MAAGLELFGTVGYRATTVRMLCRQAGLIDRYFYKTFTDTEDLLKAIYGQSMDDIQAAVMQAIAPELGSGDADRIVDAGLDAFYRAFENSRIARICWLEVLGVSAAVDALYLQRIRLFADLLLMIARSLVPKLDLHPDEARYTGVALVGAISQSAMHWLLDDYRAERAHVVAASARLLKGAMNSLRAP